MARPARVQRWPGAIGRAALARWSSALAARPEPTLRLPDALDLDDVLRELLPLRPAIAARLGAPPRVLAGQCWVRRARPPHHWHQDGALHHDFAAPGAAEPLAMLTLWVPLVRCGDDAPSLAWLPLAPPRLLRPDELATVATRGDHGAVEHAVLAAGEALLFDGALLHATHATPAMTRARTSIELRFVADDRDPRLRGEPLRDWPTR